MNGWNKLVALIGALGLMAACSGDPEPSGENQNQQQNVQNNQNQSGNDAGLDDANGNNGEDDACTPRTECDVDECGTVDDGCGGTLECGACGCEDGEPVSDTCGSCDLGKLTCEDGETGPGQCDQPDIPGFGGDCEELVFVNRGEGSPQGTGTLEDPVASLEAGVSVANTNNAVGIILAGDVEYDGPVLIDRRLSIAGGFTEEFERNQDMVPTVVSDSSVDGLDDGDVVGLSVQGVGQNHVVEFVEFETDDVEAHGATNYGVHVDDSPGLVLREVEARVGRGGHGVDGENGSPGTSGGEGDDAHETIGDSGELGDVQEDYQAGFGGENADCPEANGADGGMGAYTDEADATKGEDAADASGGARGAETTNLSDIGGDDGEDGPSVTSSGENGVGGESVGEVVDGRWLPKGNGGDGEDGAHGSGGGGGGGAGQNPDWDGDGTVYAGSYGGGGGAGGCGGEGGEGGTGGGASFGLFVVDSNIDVIRSRFFANLGGDGGDGGIGGNGGDGADGGVPSVRRTGASTIDYESEERGGFGGKGADGADGGHGGGGAGGASYGAFCSGSEITTTGTVRFSSGGAATGGSSAGLSGESGTDIDEYQCQ